MYCFKERHTLLAAATLMAIGFVPAAQAQVSISDSQLTGMTDRARTEVPEPITLSALGGGLMWLGMRKPRKTRNSAA